MRIAAVALTLGLLVPTPATGRQHQPAQIREGVRTIETYPFSDPDPVPLLTRDARLYPYHAFQGYSTESEAQDWKVVTLENDYIQVFVLPEVGGKVWGAVIKESGEEFIYRNEVMKFRNIALRGPWTSGGIEFNFGVIGHTPSTATPVDYVLLENEDGSVSCVVGTMDLPSRTHWRVEIRLEPDKAYFETNVLWQNPTSTWQPYYNWMTAAAFARDDLRMYIPGNRYLGHPGESHEWPVDPMGRYLPDYAENRFGGHKSFHVVGQMDDHFGGYYADAGYGFGHWARYEEMPGQKLWLWALSRQGGVWEDLLTDTDGQYVEYQAGRLFVQYSAGTAVNPIKEATFQPGATDRWSEMWFPVVEIGGLSDASRTGVLHVEQEDGRASIGVQALEAAVDTVRVVVAGEMVAEYPLSLLPMEVFGASIVWPEEAFEVRAPAMGLLFRSEPADGLERPFETPSEAMPLIPDTDRWVLQARELIEARRLADGRRLLERTLEREPWHREALLATADLDFREARYAQGLSQTRRVLQLDAIDPEANFIGGNLYAALGNVADAKEAYGWAARSMTFRSVAYTRLADLALGDGDWNEAVHYADLALAYDRNSLRALQNLATALRHGGTGDGEPGAFAAAPLDHAAVVAPGAFAAAPLDHAAVVARMLEIDPLNHGARAERFLRTGSLDDRAAFAGSMRSEFPRQSLLEVSIGYANRGLTDDALAVLEAGLGGSVLEARVSGTAAAAAGLGASGIRTDGSPEPPSSAPVALAWHRHLSRSESALPDLSAEDVTFTFPYRAETLPVLRAAAQASDHWSWRYLFALNLQALGHTADAGAIMEALANEPDLSSFYLTRALLGGDHAERDLKRAQETVGAGRLSLIHLVRFYQAEGRWQEAAEVSAMGRDSWPADFNMDLLHARGLLFLGRGAEAVDILEGTHVLPSENASESHQLFEWAHVMAGLDTWSTDVAAATTHFLRALDWPETLGQGRPYEPDDRLPSYLIGEAAQSFGDRESAQEAFERVVEVTESRPLDYTARLAVAALTELGRHLEAEELGRRLQADELSRRLAGAVEVGAVRLDMQRMLVDRALTPHQR